VHNITLMVSNRMKHHSYTFLSHLKKRTLTIFGENKQGIHSFAQHQIHTILLECSMDIYATKNTCSTCIQGTNVKPCLMEHCTCYVLGINCIFPTINADKNVAHQGLQELMVVRKPKMVAGPTQAEGVLRGHR
jgi:hypothetical protein